MPSSRPRTSPARRRRSAASASSHAPFSRSETVTFSGADGAAHHSVNRCHVGVLRGALTPEFHDWRPPQVADYARLVGTARYAPSQSEETVMADIRRVLDHLQTRFPGLAANLSKESAGARPTMLPFEVAHDSSMKTPCSCP